LASLEISNDQTVSHFDKMSGWKGSCISIHFLLLLPILTFAFYEQDESFAGGFRRQISKGSSRFSVVLLCHCSTANPCEPLRFLQCCHSRR